MSLVRLPLGRLADRCSAPAGDRRDVDMHAAGAFHDAQTRGRRAAPAGLARSGRRNPALSRHRAGRRACACRCRPAWPNSIPRPMGAPPMPCSTRSGRVLFSSDAGETSPIAADRRRNPGRSSFSRKKTATAATSSTASTVTADVGGRPVLLQVVEDLAHRDVLIDDIVAEFFTRVGWITAPILLLLLVIDVVIFRRAMQPIIAASALAERIGPDRTELRLPEAEHAARGAAAGARGQPGARPARCRVPRAARVHRRRRARAAHAAGDFAHPDRHDRGSRDGASRCATTSRA